ncbi:hypothetical protein SUGI_0243870 [Cryptomeria japonica]|nr:hypothetical protein SUGI_0243870 [Cryptomeria japonica]
MFEGRKSTIARNVVFLKKLMGIMLNEGGEWIKNYLQSEGLERDKEEETNFGTMIKEEVAKSGEEDDPFHTVELLARENYVLECPIKAHIEERRMIKNHKEPSECIMKMGHCKIVAVAFIVMMQLFSLAPVMACNYCPPAIKPPPANKPPPAPVMSPPMIPVVPPPAPVMSPPMIPVVPPPAPVMSPPMTPVVPPPISPSSGTCPLDALKLGACADVLGGLVHLSLGDPSVNNFLPFVELTLLLASPAQLCRWWLVSLEWNISCVCVLRLLSFQLNNLIVCHHLRV